MSHLSTDLAGKKQSLLAKVQSDSGCFCGNVFTSQTYTSELATSFAYAVKYRVTSEPWTQDEKDLRSEQITTVKTNHTNWKQVNFEKDSIYQKKVFPIT